MKNILTALLFLFVANIVNGQITYKELNKKISIKYVEMDQECSTFVIAYIKTDKKGRVDSINFLTQGNTALAANVKRSFEIIKEKREKLSKKPLMVLCINLNDATNSCSNAQYMDALRDFRKITNEECVFVGPFVFSSIK